MVVPFHGMYFGLEESLLVESVSFSNHLRMGQQFPRSGIFLSGHVLQFLEKGHVDVAFDVALSAWISIWETISLLWAIEGLR